MRTWQARRWTGWLIAALLVGCDDPTPPPPPPPPGPTLVAPGVGYLETDFQLVDSNVYSPTHAEMCSPRQQLGTISAWYFGHAT